MLYLILWLGSSFHSVDDPQSVFELLAGADTIIRVNDTGEISMFLEQFSKYQLKVQIETSVTVMAEGPHCDLTSWKHGYSRMHDITSEVAADNSFDWPEFSVAEQRIFPNVSVASLQNAVKKHCGLEWYEHMKSVKSPHEYPCNVDISRYIVRLEGVLNSGEFLTFIFYTDVAMGC